MEKPSGLTIYFSVYIFLIFLPLILLVILTFNNSLIAGFPWRGFTLKYWKLLFDKPEAIAAIFNSLKVAVFVAPVSAILGLFAAIGLSRHVFKGRKVLLGIVLGPLCAPYLLTGAGLLIYIRQILGVSLSLWTLALGHIIVALPVTTLVIMARLVGFRRSLEEAARDLGADEFRTFRKVTFPLLMPAFVTALFMGFITSLEDVYIAYFMTKHAVTVPVYIFSALRRAMGLPVIMALSSIMIVLGFFLALVFYILGKKGYLTE